MTTSLIIALLVITIIYLLLVLKAIKNGKMQISFSVFWIVSGIILIIALLIPEFVTLISQKLGFSVPSNMIFCLTIFIEFLLIFDLTLKLSKEYKRTITLVQEISLLKSRVEKLEKEKIGENDEQV